MELVYPESAGAATCCHRNRGLARSKMQPLQYTTLNPKGSRTQAYSCEENCPTGALLRVNPKDYFDGAKKAIGLVYRDQTHAIGRNIHKRDPIAWLFHIAGIMALGVFTFLTVW